LKKNQRRPVSLQQTARLTLIYSEQQVQAPTCPYEYFRYIGLLIQKTGTFHCKRHSCATHLAEGKTDLRKYPGAFGVQKQRSG